VRSRLLAAMKLLKLSFVILCTLTVASPLILPLGEGKFYELPELPDINEPRSYCGLNLKTAVRRFCRDDVIKVLKKQTTDRTFQKQKKCGQTLIAKCCLAKCTLPVFVSFCPYRYVR
jgi:hypothetical protein